ncbi:MAG: NAD(P)/FAD-dependent oxidoreductase [Lachnospiraceae bacterium]|nr:NAD(P)/FAD-dependent oxidoreductase [Lachnospiraceae bacterium]
MNDNPDVIVIGGGAAGMMAAIAAAETGKRVFIIEKNEKLGKKLFITGKGRCNLTNACSSEELFDHILSNKKFLYSAINGFSNYDVMAFFEELGVKIKTERGGRVFPVSDHSSDVIKGLENRLKTLNVDVMLNTSVKELLIKDGECLGVKTSKGSTLKAEKTIVATGGLSYPSTGSTGDGYRFAEKAGIKVTECYPGLVPFNAAGDLCKRLQGLSLKNIEVEITRNEDNKTLYRGFGEILFTHFGISGPLILTASSELKSDEYEKKPVLHIDLKPALDHNELDKRIIRDFDKIPNKEFKNSLTELLPSKLIPVITDLSGIDPYKKVNSVTRQERLELGRLIKDLKLQIDSLRGFEEAVITRGGIDVKEIDPRSFESKKISNLYFAGEVLDTDAHTGGFNLQIAWSTGYAAGKHAAGQRAAG